MDEPRTANDPRLARLFAAARAGRLSRRRLLETGLKLGLATPVISALIEAAPASAAASAMSAAVPARAAIPNAQESGGTFTALISIGDEDIDPHYSYSTLSSTIALAVYEMLLQLKGDSVSEFDPMLAESWEVSEDQSTFTFTLAPGVTFHDGSPCDAQAVKDSYTRWIELGGSPVNVITRFVESPDQMEVVDATTLRFNLGAPQPLFLSAMASQYGPSVVSPTAVAANATDEDPYAHTFFQANGVGSGPYRLEQNEITEGIILSRFEEFHRGWEANQFDQIVFRVVPEEATRRQLLEAGEADAAAYTYLAVDTYQALKESGAFNAVEYPTTAVSWAVLNAARLSKEARQGLCYAFPYDEVEEAVYRGLLKRTGPIADSTRGYDPNVFLYTTDLERARELMTTGGLAEGSTIEYMVDANDPRETTIAQLFQAQLSEIGYTLELIAVDLATLNSTMFGSQPAEEKPHVMGGWGWWPDYDDPWNQLWPNFTVANVGNGGSNAGAWENARFEEIMAEAETFTDEARLTELMVEAQNILTEQDPPAIYYGQVVRYTILGKDIQGYQPNPLYLDGFNFYGMSRSAE